MPTTTAQPIRTCGDADDDGRVNNGDVVTILQFVVGTIELNDTQLEQANVISGDLNVADADAILRALRDGTVDQLNCSFPTAGDRLSD